MTCYTTLALYLLSVLASLAHVDAAVIPIRRVQLQSHRPAMVVERLPLAARDGPQPVIVTVTTTTTSVVTVPATPTATEASSSTSSSSASSSTSTTESSSSTTSSTTTPTPTSTSTSTTSSSTTSSSSSTTTTQDAPKQTDSNPPADGSKKLVVAHHMVGNTFPYKKQDWLDDIVLAHESGIDGFSLNTGKDAWEPDRIADAYQAALESKLDFKLFISLDMTSIPCASADDGAFIRKLVLDHASHPNQLKYTSTGAAGGDRAFVSTFAGENCRFGNGGASAPDAWRGAFTQHPDVKGKVYFVPSFFIDPATFKTFAGVMDGDFNWNSGWPIKVTTGFAKDLLTNVLNKFKEAAQRTSTSKNTPAAPAAGGAIGGILNKPISQILTAATPEDGSKDFQVELGKFIGSTESDTEHLDALKGLGQAGLQKRDGEGGEGKPVYMAAVSPWFFTHYGADSFNKNFIFLADQHLYTKRWESIVDSRDKLDIVQILTWNDYGESHYIGPIKGDQPNSEAWTDGMSHTGWLQMTKYYATAFKTGKFPEIEKDQIYMWSRPHPVNAQAPDPVPQPTNFELSEDSVWVVVMATAPSTLKLSTGNGQDKSIDIPKGVSKQSIPISAGGTMKGTIERDGKTVLELAPTKEEFTFQGSPKTYNFNAFVASAVAK